MVIKMPWKWLVEPLTIHHWSPCGCRETVWKGLRVHAWGWKGRWRCCHIYSENCPDAAKEVTKVGTLAGMHACRCTTGFLHVRQSRQGSENLPYLGCDHGHWTKVFLGAYTGEELFEIFDDPAASKQRTACVGSQSRHRRSKSQVHCCPVCECERTPSAFLWWQVQWLTILAPST